jgi:hypothetical protein
VRDTLIDYRAGGMDVSTRKRTRPVSLAVLALACVLSCTAIMSSASGASSTGPKGSAERVLRAALAAATREGSVRVTVHFVAGDTTGEVVQDSAQQSGVQTVAIGKERISIVLVGGRAYFVANLQGLTSYFGLPARSASALTGRWISVSPADSAFQSVIATLTLPSALKEVTPVRTISEGRRSTVDGHSTTSISGTGSSGEARTVLFVAAKGMPLPVEAVVSGGSGKEESGEIVVFSRWGENVHTPVPTDSIPISSLSSKSPSPG